jgi:hypothetical protein
MDTDGYFITKKQAFIVWAALLLVLGVLFWIDYKNNPYAIDWIYTYYPATRGLLALQSPYQQTPYFFAPVWSLIPLIPFVLLPFDIGRALFFVASVLGFAYLGYRAGCTPMGIAALLLSAPVANCIQTGNIEWLPLLGSFLPAPVGLIFLSMKPQTTIGIILFVLFSAYKKGFRSLIWACLPTVILFMLSCLFYGWWFLRTNAIYGAGGIFILRLWPYGVPVGLACLYLAIRRRQIHIAMAASPLLSPYTILLTWSGFVLSFAKSTKAIVLVSILSWIFWIAYRAVMG